VPGATSRLFSSQLLNSTRPFYVSPMNSISPAPSIHPLPPYTHSSRRKTRSSSKTRVSKIPPLLIIMHVYVIH